MIWQEEDTVAPTDIAVVWGDEPAWAEENASAAAAKAATLAITFQHTDMPTP